MLTSLKIHSTRHTLALTHKHTFLLTHYFGLGVSLTLMDLYEIFKPLYLRCVFACVCLCQYVTSLGLCVMTNVWPTRPSDWVISQSVVLWSVCMFWVCSVSVCARVCVRNNSLQGIRMVHSALYGLKKSGKSTSLLWRIILWLFIIASELERLRTWRKEN